MKKIVTDILQKSIQIKFFNSGDKSGEIGDIGDNDGPGCSGRDDGDQAGKEMMVTKPARR